MDERTRLRLVDTLGDWDFFGIARALHTEPKKLADGGVVFGIDSGDLALQLEINPELGTIRVSGASLELKLDGVTMARVDDKTVIIEGEAFTSGTTKVTMDAEGHLNFDLIPRKPVSEEEAKARLVKLLQGLREQSGVPNSDLPDPSTPA